MFNEETNSKLIDKILENHDDISELFETLNMDIYEIVEKQLETLDTEELLKLI